MSLLLRDFSRLLRLLQPAHLNKYLSALCARSVSSADWRVG